MKKRLLSGILLVSLAVSLNAQNVAPNEVRVFRHPNYIGDSASYKVEDGMRHKLVNFLGSLDNKISSMLVGSDVAVMPFLEANFCNGSTRLHVIHAGKLLANGSTMDLRELQGPYIDSISSLIVFRKSDFGVYLNDEDPWGVWLGRSYISNATYLSRFIPLPEQEKDFEARHGLLGVGWDKVHLIVTFYTQLEITFYDQPYFQGKSLYLPGAAPETLPPVNPGAPNVLQFDLEQYEFGGKQSSLILRVRGAVPAPPEREGGGTGTVHRAPPAGGEAPKPVELKLGTITVEPISIAGTWKSNIGLVYEITQSKDKFTWKVLGQNQAGEGTITGKAVSVTWTDTKGRGGAKGKIILDRQGKAVRIEWTNGVVFTR